MMTLIYIWGAIVAFRFIKVIMGGNYGTTFNILCDLISLAGFVLAIPAIFPEDSVSRILLLLADCLFFIWLSWRTLRKDFEEGIREGNELAEAIDKFMYFFRNNISALIGAGIVIILVYAVISRKGDAIPNKPSSSYSNKHPSAERQNDTSNDTVKNNKYIDRVPFAGMEEKYINKTAVGPYTKKEEKNGWTYYYWCIGDYTVLTVKISDVIDYQPGRTYESTIKLHNVVSEVEQSYINVAWTTEMKKLPYRIKNRQYEYMNLRMPRFGPYYKGTEVTESDIKRYISNQKSNSNSGSSNYDYDDYDGYGYYDDFEDFYNDHYDDFDSYEEAENYFDAYY